MIHGLWPALLLSLHPTDSLQSLSMSSSDKMNAITRIAVGQLRSTSNKQSNLIDVAKCAGWAKKSGAAMLFLPECLGFMGDNASHTLEQADPEIDMNNQEITSNPFHQALSKAIDCPDDITTAKIDDDQEPTSIVQSLKFIARHSNVWISGGGVHTRASSSPDKQNIYNTHVIIDNNGQLQAYYHKIHLFDVSIPGKVNLQESKTTEPGTKLVLCDSPIGKLGKRAHCLAHLVYHHI